MVEIDITILITITLLSVFAVVASLFWVNITWRRQLHRYSEWIAPSSVIIETYSSRLRHVESAMLDIRSRLDLIQAKLPRIEKPVPSTPAPTLGIPEVSKEIRPTGVPIRVEVGEEDTRMRILRSLAPGPRTSTQILLVSGKTREHTLRLLKAMSEGGLISRSAWRPFLYSLTDQGRALIK